MTILDSLLVALGYEFDDDELKQFEDSIGTVTKGINNLVVAAAGLVTAFTGAAVASAGATDGLTKQARQAGMLAGELDAYNFAAEQTIGTSSGVAGALRQLAIRSSEAARGTGSAIEAFGMLGISVTDAEGRVKPINQLLGESADRLNSLSDNSLRLELADKLGLGELDLLLRQGSAGINALTKEARELGVVAEEDSRAAEAFNDQINRLRRVLTATVRFVSTQVLPMFTQIAEELQDWVRQNNELIKTRLSQFLNAVVFALRNFQLIIGLILSLKFSTFILSLAVAYKKLGNAALLANVKIFAIVIAIAAVIAAIGLLIEDFIVFQRGGDSAIGALLEKFPLLNAIFAQMGADIRQVQGWLTDFFELFFEFLRVARAATTVFFEVFFDLLTRARSFTTDVFEAIDNAVTSVVSAFSRAQTAVTRFFNKIGMAFDKIKGVFDSVKSFLGDEVEATVNTVSRAIQEQPGLSFTNSQGSVNPSPQRTPLFSPQTLMPSGAGGTTTVRNENTLNINGGDLNSVRRTVEEVINGKIEQASSNAQSPVVS